MSMMSEFRVWFGSGIAMSNDITSWQAAWKASRKSCIIEVLLLLDKNKHWMAKAQYEEAL